jgi:pterin-4a-carbinolamine dehydratase
LKATHVKTLEYISLETFLKFEYTPISVNDWALVENKFEKTFEFNDYNEVVLFANKVMQISIKQDHHPVINIKYYTINVSITDHEKGCVSEKCHRLITEVNNINIVG